MNKWKILLFVLISFMSSFVFAKEYYVKDIQGQEMNFSIPSDRWTVINYWATWCSACVDELPELNKFQSTIANKAVTFFGVNIEGLPASQLRAFASHYNMNYPITRLNPIENLVSIDSLESIPVTVVISPEGKVNILRGEQTMGDILQAMS